MAKGKVVSYLRVSTQRQGASGLGLAAQREAVAGYLNGGSWSLVSEVVEVESGKRNDRPGLTNALRLCRLYDATLVVAKLDRLARNVAFISALMESGVEFVAVDFPQANRFTVHILAAVAEHEAVMISARTKAALAAAKARGTKLGGYRWDISQVAAKGTAESAKARTAKASKRAADLLPMIEDIKAGGATSLRAIARVLNERGIASPSGGQWHANSVRRLLPTDAAEATAGRLAAA
jgi:DNA invertase Pin-like site-specific DNA recombinase